MSTRQHALNGPGTPALVEPPALEIVIVAYRCRDLVAACLESIATHGTLRGRVLTHVVDNASDDGTVELVRDAFPGVRCWPLADNTGFSVANNLVLRQVTAPYVLVLNPDTELREGVLDHLLGVLDDAPDIGMIGCRLEQRDGTFDHAAKRGFPTPVSALAHFTKIGRSSNAAASLAQYRAPDVDEHEFGDVDAINGAFMLVRTCAVRQVGPFDPGYWLYMEDLDWCQRFHEGGWRVVYDGRVTTLHIKGGTAGTYRGLRQNIAFHRGMGRFYRRFQSGQSVPLDLLVYVGIGVKLLLSASVSAVRRRSLG